MTKPARTAANSVDAAEQERQEIRSYLLGAAIALFLTLAPFALMHWHVMSRVTLLIVIAGCALVQIIVHFRFFLHIGFSHQREDLQLILFSTLLMTIMIGGTVWIMTSLALRMGMGSIH
jgi:cytochrome o ubiquinol oxidase subunit IV